MTTTTMTKAQKREMRDVLRTSLEEVCDDLASAKDEMKDLLDQLAEVKNRIADLREDRQWRIEALKFLAQK